LKGITREEKLSASRQVALLEREGEGRQKTSLEKSNSGRLAELIRGNRGTKASLRKKQSRKVGSDLNNKKELWAEVERKQYQIHGVVALQILGVRYQTVGNG